MEVCPKVDEKWQDNHKVVRATLGISPSFKPWTQAPGTPPRLSGVPDSARMRDLIDIAWSSRHRKHRTLPFYCDISQCASRMKWGTELGCMTTSARIYDFGQDKVLSSFDMFLLQGLPAREMHFVEGSHRQLYKLAGEGMFCPSVSMLMLAVRLNPLAPWWATPA